MRLHIQIRVLEATPQQKNEIHNGLFLNPNRIDLRVPSVPLISFHHHLQNALPRTPGMGVSPPLPRSKSRPLLPLTPEMETVRKTIAPPQRNNLHPPRPVVSLANRTALLPHLQTPPLQSRTLVPLHRPRQFLALEDRRLAKNVVRQCMVGCRTWRRAIVDQ